MIGLFRKLGGEEGIQQLVERFYHIMDKRKDVARIRALHPEDLTGSKDRLYKFLVGWSGGPPLYISEFGHPRLRARHLPFPIGEEERDQWILCMQEALEQQEVDLEAKRYLMEKLTQMADFLRNQEG